MSDNVEVGRGLNRIFIGQLLVIVAMILAIIPPAGLFAVVAALVLPMMGLYQAGRVDKGYHMALVLSVVARVSGLLCRSIGVPDLLGYILEFAVVYLVCTKTARRLEAEGDLSTAARGRFVWKLDAACLAVTLLSGLLVPIMGERLVGLLLVTLVAALANAVFYMTFLYRASKRLQE